MNSEQYAKQHNEIRKAREYIECWEGHPDSVALDYADGGELRCCICGGFCKQHWANGDVPDIGECCATMVAYASRMSGLSGNALRCRILRSQMEVRR